ncbi:hypothetical protein [Chryseobacterium sp.]|uniref:hypothetical protein n=1 Tax=Chryseobacterium sp. TaxID=1871047 RepID=UPI0025C2D585|nr:hypothetical protein [Chryseobacterium sp.]
MESQKILKSLRSENFKKINNKGDWFENNASIYAKEINTNIFLLFIIMKDFPSENIEALIARFENFNSIGKHEPIQLMFYLSIKDRQDFHYFEKYMKIND